MRSAMRWVESLLSFLLLIILWSSIHGSMCSALFTIEKKGVVLCVFNFVNASILHVSDFCSLL